MKEFLGQKIHESYRFKEILEAYNVHETSIGVVVHNMKMCLRKDMEVYKKWARYFRNVKAPFVSLVSKSGVVSIVKRLSKV